MPVELRPITKDLAYGFIRQHHHHPTCPKRKYLWGAWAELTRRGLYRETA